MTCIVGVQDANGYVVIGADRAAEYRGRSLTYSQPKIWRDREWIVGVAGTLSQRQVISMLPLPNLDSPDMSPSGMTIAVETRAPLSITEHLQSWLQKVRSQLRLYGPVGAEDPVACQLLIARGPHLWVGLQSGCLFSDTRPYAAIGSGAEFALGALHACFALRQFASDGLIERAIRAACSHSASCGMPADIFTTDARDWVLE